MHSRFIQIIRQIREIQVRIVLSKATSNTEREKVEVRFSFMQFSRKVKGTHTGTVSCKEPMLLEPESQITTRNRLQ